MKPILAEEFIEQHQDTQSQFNVDVDGNTYSGYQISKPLNFDPEYLSKKERQEMADAIMAGKAIAVCFFEDLTPEEQSDYVKRKINE